MKWFGVITIFPEMLEAITNWGMTKQAIKAQQISIEAFNLRDYTSDKHRTVDERPFGGGPGMLMLVEPLEKALLAAKDRAAEFGGKVKVILLSPQGYVFNHKASLDLAADDCNYIFVCGRYEGIDQRFIDLYVDEEWSIGDFVLTGGELGAMIMIDAIIRHLPGVLNHNLSAVEDSFAQGLLDCPHYTRPVSYKGIEVPPVLLSGNHAAIAAWREEEALKRTLERRPEMIAKLEEEQSLTKSQERTLAKLRGLPDPYPPRSPRRKKKSSEFVLNSDTEAN